MVRFQSIRLYTLDTSLPHNSVCFGLNHNLSCMRLHLTRKYLLLWINCIRLHLTKYSLSWINCSRFTAFAEVTLLQLLIWRLLCYFQNGTLFSSRFFFFPHSKVNVQNGPLASSRFSSKLGCAFIMFLRQRLRSRLLLPVSCLVTSAVTDGKFAFRSDLVKHYW